MNLLVLGASGLVGSHLFDGLSEEYIVHGTYLNNAGPPSRMFRWDILKDNPQILLQRGRPDAIINTIHPPLIDGAVELLCDVFGALAEFCRVQGIHLVHFSSDAVFGGADGVFKEESACSPSTQYGIAKRKIEETLLKSGCSLGLLRVSHVFGRYPDDNLDSRLQSVESSLSSGLELKRFRDYYKQPLWAGELVRPVGEILRRNFTGTLHIAGEPHNSYETARAFAIAAGYRADLVKAVLKNEAEPGKAVRSRSLLCAAKAKNDFGFSPLPLPLAMGKAVRLPRN